MVKCPVIFALLLSLAAWGEDLPGGIEVRKYGNWQQCIYLNVPEKQVQAVIVPSLGGRALNFSYNEDNILYENPAVQPGSTGSTSEDLMIGGYQCDIGPPGRNLPAHFQLLQERNESETKTDFTAHVSSIPDPDLGVVLEKTFVLAPDTGNLGVVQKIRNISNKDISYCLWDRTVCRDGGFVLIPLNKKSRFPAGWSILRRTPRSYFSPERSHYDGQHPGAPQARVLDDVLVVSASGDPVQIGVDSTAGWIAYARGKLLFVKYFPYFNKANYSDNGHSVEMSIQQHAVEISPLSPEVRLVPGQEYSFPEKWLLIPLRKEVTTWEEARKLLRKIRPSPFGS